MIYKINEIYNKVKDKKISLKKIKDFFSLGLELGIFKVSGNEGGEIIYENHDNKGATSNQVLLNEQKKEEPKPGILITRSHCSKDDFCFTPVGNSL